LVDQGLGEGCRQIVVPLLEEFVWGPLWGVPSHNPASPEAEGFTLTPQVRNHWLSAAE